MRSHARAASSSLSKEPSDVRLPSILHSARQRPVLLSSDTPVNFLPEVLEEASRVLPSPLPAPRPAAFPPLLPRVPTGGRGILPSRADGARARIRVGELRGRSRVKYMMGVVVASKKVVAHSSLFSAFCFSPFSWSCHRQLPSPGGGFIFHGRCSSREVRVKGERLGLLRQISNYFSCCKASPFGKGFFFFRLHVRLQGARA